MIRKSTLASTATTATEQTSKKITEKKIDHNNDRNAVQSEKNIIDNRPKQTIKKATTPSPETIGTSETKEKFKNTEQIKSTPIIDDSKNAISNNSTKDETVKANDLNHSPTTPIPSMTASSSFSWARERALEQQIDGLRETLKDTEERLQSLRLQYENVSQMHRKLRETNTKMQEDMEHLKIDSQHLRECANIIRNELQAARKDRAEAIDMQKLLQRELDENREAKKKLTGENETNAKKILDLQRQCKEMERIIARKNPSAMASILCK